jgi:hypothetical protein
MMGLCISEVSLQNRESPKLMSHASLSTASCVPVSFQYAVSLGQ